MRHSFAVVAFLLIAPSSFAATFTVTNGLDSGPGTLRQAILDANANPGFDEIRFSTNASHTLNLPSITDVVRIDGDRAGSRSTVTGQFFDGSTSFRFAAGSSGSTLRRLRITNVVFAVRIDAGVSNVTVAANHTPSTMIEVRGDNNLVGGTATGEGNLNARISVIGGASNEMYRNTAARISLIASTDSRVGNPGNGNFQLSLAILSSSAIIEGNTFSHPFEGTYAILVDVSSGTTITGNTISGFPTGIRVLGSPTHAAISANSIFGTGIPIDLGGDGPTPNDPSPDADTGPNDLQNFPVLTSAILQIGSLTMNGTLTSAPLTQYRIEFFSDDAADPETRTFLGSVDVTTDATGNAAFSRTITSPLPVADEVITSTATNLTTGDTSEVSGPVDVTQAGQLSVSTTTLTVNEQSGSVDVTVTRTGGSEGTVTVQYATADGTATAPADYTAVSGTLIFGPGVTTQTVTIPIVGDAIAEPSESFTLTLSNPTGGATLGASTTMIVIAAQLTDAPTLSTWALLVLIAGLTLVALRR